MSRVTPPPPGAWVRLRKNPVALAAMGILAFIVFMALLGPFIFHTDAHTTSKAQFEPPSSGHVFRTDNNGRDSFSRVLEGARISLLVGISGALISLIVGTT